MIIHGFAFMKFAKLVHEHHLQVLPSPQAWFRHIYWDIKATPPNFNKIFTFIFIRELN
jgi:zona occludens toxin (predicted ATPase)